MRPVTRLTREIDTVLDGIWVPIFTLYELLSGLVCNVIVITAVSSGYFTTKLQIGPLAGLAVFAPVQYVFWSWRAREYQKIVESEIEAEEKMQEKAIGLFRDSSLIHHFVPRADGADAINARLLDSIREHGLRMKQMCFHAIDSSWLSEYISSLMVILWLLFGGYYLVDTQHFGNSNVNVGGFFAVLRTYISANRSYTAIATRAASLTLGRSLVIDPKFQT